MSGTGEDLTYEEQRAIKALRRLTNHWPRSLTLASMGGSLVVVRTGDERFSDGANPGDRAEAIITDFGSRIPNTGGDW